MRLISKIITWNIWLILLLPSAQATLISGIDSSFSPPTPLQVISAPGSMLDMGAMNSEPQGFDELQNFTLMADLIVDNGTITAGTTINSQMIFLNPNPSDTINFHNALWTFGEDILGVISSSIGLDDSDFLGAPGTLYPLGLDYRGLEDAPGIGDDIYTISDNTLAMDMHVFRGSVDPGDWVRVITSGQPIGIPEPLTLALMGGGLLGLFCTTLFRNRRAYNRFEELPA